MCFTTDAESWKIDEVCRLLRCIGLSEHEENFTKHNVQGKELLSMQKQDLIVSKDLLYIPISFYFFQFSAGSWNGESWTSGQTPSGS